MIGRLWRWLAGRRPPRGGPMLPVPAGRVRLDDGRRKRVAGFELDVHPVTNADWEAYVQDTGAARPQWMYRPGFGDLERPVVGVTLADARAYARWAGKRLPTEREWMRAARGDDDRRFPWGDTEAAAPFSHFGQSGGGAPAPVSAETRPAGRAPFGHVDLCGNVWEWCHDGALRGGFWGSKRVGIAERLVERADRVSGGIGFRCAR